MNVLRKKRLTPNFWSWKKNKGDTIPSQLASAPAIRKRIFEMFFPHGLVSPFRAESDLRLRFIKLSTDRYTIAKGGTYCQLNYMDGHLCIRYMSSCNVFLVPVETRGSWSFSFSGLLRSSPVHPLCHHSRK